MKSLDQIRTDVIGSLLRPRVLKEARARFDEQLISRAELQKIEDDAVRDAIRMQEAIGLQVVSDGEFRRLNFQDSFGESVGGYDSAPVSLKSYDVRAAGARPLSRFDLPFDHEPFKGTPVVQRQRVIERLFLKRNLPLEEYQSAARFAHQPLKVSLIGPDRISQRVDHKNSTAIYPTMDAFMADVVRVEREIVKSVVDAGCRYVHVDAPGYTAYVDGPSLDAMRKRGEDPHENFARSLRADNELMSGFDGVTFGLHLCRGNQRSMWHREGAYDAIAERLFNELNHQRFLLEYDSPRAGSFEPLRFVPKGRVVVLGLVSTKVPELETVDDLRRRIDEAARYLSLDQLALSPQCGFASEFVGNLISEDDQRRKLEVVVETARQVWG
jgi:methionine synthase II (cobalamin-independent)